MKVLFLYAEVMGYTVANFRELVRKNAEITVVHWDHKKLTPYNIPPIDGVKVYPRSEMTVQDIFELTNSCDPDITYVSGWQDFGYLRVVRRLRKDGKVVVAGFDDQWFGSMRQQIAAVIGRGRFFSIFFSHAWVSGAPQFEYARRIGFKPEEIIFDLVSADVSNFSDNLDKRLEVKKISYPHCFLFVGRFNEVKGIDVLIDAWKRLEGKREDWELVLVGNGSFMPDLSDVGQITIKDFLQPDQLIKESDSSGCFILPSNNEPWGVVVHEFASAGMPLILSNAVGSGSIFLISGLNGYSFSAGDPDDLSEKMLSIINMSDHELLIMSRKSYVLSGRITTESSVNNLLSLFVK